MQYIQVIDVEGRQCSDFLAFDSRRLSDGVERGLDATTTRNLMGNAYPQPGLYGKFFDQDMRPLVEVVRDTVGRHDTFALACNAKYYEDLGYPGHVNCTDNFNGQLARFGDRGAPRLARAELLLQHLLQLPPTSSSSTSPGLAGRLRAAAGDDGPGLCASSACPDDIDPANAWNPTDIHVRVYPAERRFSMAIAHRVTPDAEPKLTRETAFQPRWSALTRRITEYRGYWLPTSFDNHGAVDEYWACREGAVVMDLSPLRKFEVVGPDAEALLQAAVTRNIRKLADGQVVYTAMCNETGGMLDDATVFRLAADRFRFVGGDEHDGDLAARARREARTGPGVGQAFHRSAAQHRGAGAEVARTAARPGVDAADAARVRRLGLVPVRDRPDRRAAGAAADRVAHRVHR